MKQQTKQQASLQLVEFFERNGHVRLQNADRFNGEGSQSYKKGDEVRLTANSAAELEQIQELLRILDFTPGRPFTQGKGQFRLPIYGRGQTARFLALVEEYSAQTPSS